MITVTAENVDTLCVGHGGLLIRAIVSLPYFAELVKDSGGDQLEAIGVILNNIRIGFLEYDIDEENGTGWARERRTEKGTNLANLANRDHATAVDIVNAALEKINDSPTQH